MFSQFILTSPELDWIRVGSWQLDKDLLQSVGIDGELDACFLIQSITYITGVEYFAYHNAFGENSA
jgi:hypothetical protein